MSVLQTNVAWYSPGILSFKRFVDWQHLLELSFPAVPCPCSSLRTPEPVFLYLQLMMDLNLTNNHLLSSSNSSTVLRLTTNVCIPTMAFLLSLSVLLHHNITAGAHYHQNSHPHATCCDPLSAITFLFLLQLYASLVFVFVSTVCSSVMFQYIFCIINESNNY